MATLEALLDKVAGYREEMIEAQRQLVAVPALGPTNGGDGEAAKAELVEAWCRDLGLKVERVDAPDDRVPSGIRPNLVATLPGGDGPKVWVLSHLDVVPVGSLDLWQGDPWTLRVEGDRMHGRGVQDDHAGLVSSFFAAKAMVELGQEAPGDVGLIIVSDEETGSLYGLDYVVENRSDLFSPEDLIVVPDVGEPDGLMIEVAEKSILWLKVTVTGKQVHGSTPHKGVNALYASARMIVAVREVAARFPQQDPLFSLPVSSLEPTRKEAGVENINTIPGRDVFYIDCRILPEIPLEEVLAAFRETFQTIAAEEGAGVEIEAVQQLQAPPGTDPGAPVVKALMSAIKKVRGLDAHAQGVGGGTVAAFFRQRNLPVAVWMTCMETVHMPDEWASIEAQVKDAQVFALLFAGMY